MSSNRHIAVKTRNGVTSIGADELWNRFANTPLTPQHWLREELKFLATGSQWDSFGFSIADIPPLVDFCDVQQLHGVDLFVVLLTLYRAREVSFNNGQIQGRKDYQDQKAIDVPALNDLGKQIRVSAGILPLEPTFLGEVHASAFEEAERIGRGAYADVFKARLLSRTVNCAFKHLTTGDDIAQQLEDEVELLRNLKHNNIVTIFGFCKQPSRRGLFLELMEYNLLSFVKDHPRALTPEERLHISLEIASGLVFLHSKAEEKDDILGSVRTKERVIHRDLKPENILLADGLQKVKLTDFGLSRTFDSIALASSFVGTPKYMAPEVIFKFFNPTAPKYGAKADVFSYGQLLFFILTEDHKPPDHKIVPNISTAMLPDHPIIQALWDVMLRCRASKPENRPSMEEVHGVLCSLQNPPMNSGMLYHALFCHLILLALLIEVAPDPLPILGSDESMQ